MDNFFLATYFPVKSMALNPSLQLVLNSIFTVFRLVGLDGLGYFGWGEERREGRGVRDIFRC